MAGRARVLKYMQYFCNKQRLFEIIYKIYSTTDFAVQYNFSPIKAT